VVESTRQCAQIAFFIYQLHLMKSLPQLPVAAAVKTGMLFSPENIRVVAGLFQNLKLKAKKLKLIVDPVMVSTSGARLLQPAAEKILKEKLLLLATLVTPNLDEAQILAGAKITSPEKMRWAAREIHASYGCAVLLKGGHLKNSREAIDIFFDGKSELLLSAPFVKGVSTHGTGCTYSAAICAALALGHSLPHAVEIGKNFITEAISRSYKIGKHFALGQLAGDLRIPSAGGKTSSHSHGACSCCS
jgi:hydroxymethylpyrimidine/phosphomethylpyrimidine kinase